MKTARSPFVLLALQRIKHTAAGQRVDRAAARFTAPLLDPPPLIRVDTGHGSSHRPRLRDRTPVAVGIFRPGAASEQIAKTGHVSGLVSDEVTPAGPLPHLAAVLTMRPLLDGLAHAGTLHADGHTTPAGEGVVFVCSRLMFAAHVHQVGTPTFVTARDFPRRRQQLNVAAAVQTSYSSHCTAQLHVDLHPETDAAHLRGRTEGGDAARARHEHEPDTDRSPSSADPRPLPSPRRNAA